MKLLKGILFAMFILGGLASCSKDDESSAIIGTWEGYWGFDFDEPSYFEKWEIKKGGDFTVYNSNGGKIGDGRWELNGFNFSAHYTHASSDNTYKYSALYSDVAGEITGNWGEAPSSSDGGTFTMHKQ